MATDWIPPSHVPKIVAPALPGRQRLHDLRGQQCLIEYNGATARLITRQVILVDARNAAFSILVRAYTVGGPKHAVAEYRLHGMVALTGPDQIRREPRAYFRHHFGMVIE